MDAATERQDFFLVGATFIGAALDTSSVFAELANTTRDSDRSRRLRAKARNEFEVALSFCERYPKFIRTRWAVIEEKMQALRDTVLASDSVHRTDADWDVIDARFQALRGTMASFAAGHAAIPSTIDLARFAVPSPYRALSDADARRLAALTQREMEVLKLIGEGKRTKEIAYDLGITFKTAVTHRSNLMEKLGIHEGPKLVRFAIRAGLVEP